MSREIVIDIKFDQILKTGKAKEQHPGFQRGPPP